MHTFQWGVLTMREGKAGLIFRFSSISAILVFVICLASGIQAHAADDSQSFEAPDNTTQAWVDVEATNASTAGICGKLSDEKLTFKPSPSGMTAVIKAQAGEQTLVLQSQEDIDARLSVTFADANNVILSEHSQGISLKASKTPTPVPPKGDDDSGSQPGGNTANGGNAGNGGNSDNANTNMPNGTVHHNQGRGDASGNISNMVATGAAISVIAVLVVILIVAGIVVIRRKHAAHAQRKD